MSRSARSLTCLVSVALLALAACGVEVTTPEAFASGGGGSVTTTNPVLPPCAPGESGGTGGAVGGGDPTCIPQEDPAPPKTTATTEPELDEAGYIDALERSLDRDPSLKLSSDGSEAACAAPLWIETLRAERLADAGLEPSDLARLDVFQEFTDIIDLDEATEMVDALTGCGADLKTTIASAIADAASLTADQQTCFVRELADGVIESSLALSLAEGQTALESDAAFTDAVTDAAATCR